MKRKWICGLLMTATIVTGIVMITSCSKNTQESSTTTTDTIKEVHTISFVTNCDVVYNKVKGESGTKVILPTPSKEGYTFTGWYLDSGLTQKFTENVFLDTDITLYAGFSLNTYTITFITKSKTSVDSIVAYEGDELSLPTPENEGYTFLGWYTSDGVLFEDTTMPKKNITLYAEWKISSCTITLVDTLHSLQDYVLCGIGKTISIEDLSDIDYEFNGWYYDELFENKYEATDIFEKNTTLYASFKAKDYTITFDGYDDVKVGHAKENIKLPVKEKEGYTFLGWSLTKDLADPITTYQIPSGGHEESLYPVFEINTYTLIFSTNGGSSIDPIVFTFGDKIILPADPTRNGYKFAGWNNISTGTSSYDNVIPDTMPSHDITLKAKWDLLEYTITYELNGGTSEVNLKTSFNAETDYTPPKPIKTGYNCDGWYFDEDFLEPTEGIYKGSYGNKTLYAKWSPIEYVIDYQTAGGVLPNGISKTYTIADNVTFVTDITKSGYQFLGWYTDPLFKTGSKVDGITAGSTGRITIYAKWQIISYNISYTYNDGAITESQKENLKTTYTVTDNFDLVLPTKTGYTFTGWYSTSELDAESRVYDVHSGMTGDLNLYAGWVITEYKITYVTNGGAMKKDAVLSYTYDTGLITLSSPVWQGAEFEGWFKEESLETSIESFDSTLMSNIRVYAKWKFTEYTITYELNGGAIKSDAPATYTVKDSITFATPTKSGYSFYGWYLESTYNREKNEIKAGEYGNVTIYAKWGPIRYSITYDLNGGKASDLVYEYTADTKVVFPTPTRKNYTFLGWKTAEGSYITSTAGQFGDLKLTADWEETKYTITYVLDGGTNAPENKDKITKDDTFVLKAPTKTNYAFFGWYSTEDFAEDSLVTAIYQNTHEDMTLYAKFVTIYSYNSDGKITGLNPLCEDLVTELIIPDSIDGVVINGISNGAFKDNTKITKVVFNSNITGTGTYTFQGCTSLAEIEWNSNIDSIGTNAFMGCTSLTSVSLTNKLSIATGAFANCTGLTSVYVPACDGIANEAFSGCSSLKEMTINYCGSEEGDGSYSFGSVFGTTEYQGSTLVKQVNASSQTTNYYVPTTLTKITFMGMTIGNYSFNGMTTLTEFVAPKAATIGFNAFENCDNLTTFTGNVNVINKYAFHNCQKLEAFPGDSINIIGEYAFSKCSKLSSIKTTNLTEISDYAFEQCESLISVDLYKVTTVGEGAFSLCTSLSLVKLTNGNVVGKKAFSKCTNLAIVDLGSTKELKEAAFEGCSVISAINTKSVQIIGASAFSGCKKISSFSLLNATTIKENAFEGCTSVENFNLLSVTDIGYGVFKNCKLNSLVLPFLGSDKTAENAKPLYYFYGENNNTADSIQALNNIVIKTGTIVSGAFAGCNLGVVQLTVFDTITEGAFKNATVKEVELTNTTTIASRAFENATITTMKMPKVTTVEEEAFKGITMDDFVLPTTVTSIGQHILTGSTIKSIDVPFIGPDESKPEILSYFFKVVTQAAYMPQNIPSSLTKITVRSETIKEWAFYKLTNITSISIPNAKTIQQYAFQGMTGLTSIDLPSSLENIGLGILGDCDSIESISLYFTGNKKNLTSTDKVYPFGYLFGNSCSNDATSITYTYGSIPDNAYSGNPYEFGIPSSLKTVIFKGTTINPYAFYKCPVLLTIEIDESCTAIGLSAFEQCKITSVVINSAASVSKYAFKNCTSLNMVCLYNISLTLDDNSFTGCSAISEIHYNGTREQWNDAKYNYGVFSASTKHTVYCTDAKFIESQGAIPDGI